mmetsp:Transcript_40333/g.115338  ORF Transcript_40333/g.115338 Transcript_40333/m.115338 type:complete len:343 (+) Transcript_40333:130-1158(+)
MRQVAVCLAGLLRSLPDVGESIQEFLVGPLDADLFVAGPAEHLAEWASALALFPTLAQVRLERENVTEFLHALGGNGAGWRAAATIKGNWLGCLEGEEKDMRRRGSGLCQMYGHRQCLEMVTDRELKRGRQYEHVVWSRPDFVWLAAHPPLSLLPEGESDFWIIDGEDNGGINDRHWVLPRHLAPAILGSWDRLIDGSMADFFQQQRLPELSTETYFSFVLATSGVDKLIRRIPSLAFVPCANPHKRKQIDTSASSWDDSGRLDNVNVRCVRGGPKYRHEYRHARQVSDCKGSREWSLPLLWECWCAPKEELGMLHFMEYRLCVHAKVAAAGWKGKLDFYEE